MITPTRNRAFASGRAWGWPFPLLLSPALILCCLDAPSWFEKDRTEEALAAFNEA